MNIFASNRAVIVDTSHSPHSLLRPVPINCISLEKGFWQSRVQIVQTETLNTQYLLLEATGRLDNFRRVFGESDRPYQGYVFNDSDVYKWLEAAAWTMIYTNNEQLQQMVDQVITLISKAQDKNGYINTYFSMERSIERWTNLQEKHELYCAGHLIQAAIAHYRATGGSRLLNVALQLADHINSEFGPASQIGTSGHPEIEMALIELYRTTSEIEYLKLAATFIDRRGHQFLGGREYYIDHVPFRQLEYLAGHAVRALYLCSGATDLLLETGEPQLKTTLERLWTNMVRQQMYITGGLGARHDGEAFGNPYELPNARAYAETCAAIASLMWNWRMLQINGDARYSDLLEWTYYNAVLPGISLDGKEYFYTNPLKSDGNHRRQKWFDCACCPPNISRAIAEFQGYMYSVSDEGIWLHLYASSWASFDLRTGQKVELIQSTRYPWDGYLTLRITNLISNHLTNEPNEDEEFSLFLRIPGWLADQRAAIKINGENFMHTAGSGSYLEIHRRWQIGDMISIDFPMDVRYIMSHPLVEENTGRTTITRGPLVYCMEEADNPEVNLSEIVINTASQLMVEFQPNLLGGIIQLRCVAQNRSIDPSMEAELYLPINSIEYETKRNMIEVLFIPYYAWANRTPGAMEIWHLYS